MLFGRGDDHVERHVPAARSRSGPTREPGAARSVATMQLLPAAALLARVDRTWSQRDTLPHVSRTRPNHHVSDGDDQPLVGGDPRAGHAPMQPRTTSVGSGNVARVPSKTLDGGIMAQAASEVVQSELDQGARR